MNTIQSIEENQWSLVIAKFASCISILFGTIFLLGWIFYFWLPENYLPILVRLKPNSALCLILVGISL